MEHRHVAEQMAQVARLHNELKTLYSQIGLYTSLVAPLIEERNKILLTLVKRYRALDDLHQQAKTEVDQEVDAFFQDYGDEV